MDAKVVKKRIRRSSRRITCEFCDKDYATKEGIMKHSVSAHHRRYDRKTGETAALTPGELSDEMKKVRRAQYRGKSPATFSPSGAPEKQFRGKKVHPSEQPEDTDSVGSITFQPGPEPEMGDQFHTAGQPSTSRSVECAPAPDNCSVRSEDVDVDLLENTLALDSVSTASPTPARTSTPLPRQVVLDTPAVPQSGYILSDVSSADSTPSVPQQYSPQCIRVWAGLMLSTYSEEPVQAFTELLTERRPLGVLDDHLTRAIATFNDYEAGHRQALSLVHDILRAADLSSPASVLLAVAGVASLTQRAMFRPYEDTILTNSPVPVIPGDTEQLSGDSEGALIIDIHTDEDSDPSQYSEGSDETVAYAAE